MQQFTIQSEAIRDKLNTLLPSQNLGSIGVELTGSTQVIPIVDLTEVAEGSNLRQDLQTSLSLGSVTAFSVQNTTSTIINTTGYYRVFGTFDCLSASAALGKGSLTLTDGTTSKIILTFNVGASATVSRLIENYDFMVLLQAGDSLTCTSSSTSVRLNGVTRQIADLSGNLVNP